MSFMLAYILAYRLCLVPSFFRNSKECRKWLCICSKSVLIYKVECLYVSEYVYYQ